MRAAIIRGLSVMGLAGLILSLGVQLFASSSITSQTGNVKFSKPVSQTGNVFLYEDEESEKDDFDSLKETGLSLFDLTFYTPPPSCFSTISDNHHLYRAATSVPVFILIRVLRI